jgi:hypothetical protein
MNRSRRTLGAEVRSLRLARRLTVEINNDKPNGIWRRTRRWSGRSLGCMPKGRILVPAAQRRALGYERRYKTCYLHPLSWSSQWHCGRVHSWCDIDYSIYNDHQLYFGTQDDMAWSADRRGDRWTFGTPFSKDRKGHLPQFSIIFHECRRTYTRIKA